jgi:rubrerythrin
MPAGNLEEILDFAIAGEQEAHDFYLDLAKKVERPGMDGLFTQFAREELGHKKRLEGIKKGIASFAPSKKVVDLKIGDYLVEVDPSATLTYQNSLILAMKREKAAFHLYTDLAAQTDDAEAKQIFESLAQEEAKHKLRFEVEYDDMILTEN